MKLLKVLFSTIFIGFSCYGAVSSVFTALELPKDLINSIKTTQAQIKKVIPDFVPQHEDDLHVTLQFITGGDVDTSQEAPLKQALNNVAQTTYPFDITSNVNGGKFTYLPGGKFPGQIVLLLIPIPTELNNLWRNLGVEMDRLRVAYSKKHPTYLPHITLGVSKASNILPIIQGLLIPQTNQFIVDKFFLKKRTSTNITPWFENFGEYGFLPTPKVADLKPLQDDLLGLYGSLWQLEQLLP